MHTIATKSTKDSEDIWNGSVYNQAKSIIPTTNMVRIQGANDVARKTHSFKQIEEHFDGTEVGKIRGHMQARHVTTRRLTDQEEQREIDTYLKSAVNPKGSKDIDPMVSVPELRNMKIGYQTGSDIAVGPGLTKAVFVDKASGFKWSMTMKNKSQLPEAFSE